MPDISGRPDLQREIYLQWSKGLGRAIDYLETRSDIDIKKLAFFGLSPDAVEGSRLIAVEPRIKAAVLAVGGSSSPTTPPEVDPCNVAPRVKIPVLMINGRDDFILPLETSQIPLSQLSSCVVWSPCDSCPHSYGIQRRSEPGMTQNLTRVSRLVGPQNIFLTYKLV